MELQLMGPIIYYSIFLALGFICMGLYLRFRYKDKFNDLDK